MTGKRVVIRSKRGCSKTKIVVREYLRNVAQTKKRESI